MTEKRRASAGTEALRKATEKNLSVEIPPAQPTEAEFDELALAPWVLDQMEAEASFDREDELDRRRKAKASSNGHRPDPQEIVDPEDFSEDPEYQQALHRLEVREWAGNELRTRKATALWTPPTYEPSLGEELALKATPVDYTFSELQPKGSNAVYLTL